MRVVFTDQALISIKLSFDFLHLQGVSSEKISSIFKRIFDRIDGLTQTLSISQKEFFMPGSEKEYRRIVESHFKIIYYLENDTIFITDLFDSRQDPKNRKG